MKNDEVVLMPREIVYFFPNDWWVVLHLLSTEHKEDHIKNISWLSCESKYMTSKSVDILSKNGIVNICQGICSLNNSGMEIAKELFYSTVLKGHRHIARNIRNKLIGGESVFNINLKEEMGELWNI